MTSLHHHQVQRNPNPNATSPPSSFKGTHDQSDKPLPASRDLETIKKGEWPPPKASSFPPDDGVGETEKDKQARAQAALDKAQVSPPMGWKREGEMDKVKREIEKFIVGAKHGMEKMGMGANGEGGGEKKGSEGEKVTAEQKEKEKSGGFLRLS